MQLLIGSVWEPLDAYYNDFVHEKIIVTNTKTTTTKRVFKHKKIRMNCDKIGLKLKFNHDDQNRKHEMCKKKVETKYYFNNI
jgi:hypothetical protein